jgi:menaquinol-cytochrome c reductase iron-sulfur subunit
MRTQSPEPQIDRRGFLKQSLIFILGGIALLTPAIAAFVVLTDPLRRKTAPSSAVRVTNLDALPEDGVPRKFPVLAAKTDAWNKFANAPIGAVYLRRTKGNKVEALNVVCPHAGCFVDFLADQGKFLCPCHRSSFKVDGAIDDARSPSPRGLDSLTVEVRSDGSVWVQFQNFQAGTREKVPVA